MSDHHSDSAEPRRLTDPELIQVHEHAGEEKVDDGGNFKLLPLVMLFVFSGLIFFGGTYLGLFSGHFGSTVHDERGSPHAAVVAAKVGLGLRELLDLAFTVFPSPTERQVSGKDLGGQPVERTAAMIEAGSRIEVT